MILLLASALALMSEPVVCEVTIERGPRGAQVAAACPEPEVEQLANSLLSDVGLPRSATPLSLSLEWRFTPHADAQGWSWPPLRLLMDAPWPPESMLRSGASAHCVIGGTPDRSGTLRRRHAECVLSPPNPSSASAMERILTRSAYRVVPGSDAPCWTAEFAVILQHPEPESWPDARAVCTRVLGR